MSNFRNTSISGKYDSSDYFEKTQVLKDDQTDTNFIAPHRMYFYRSESILDSLKSVFNVYSRKLLLNSFGSPSRKCAWKPKEMLFWSFASECDLARLSILKERERERVSV